MKKAKFMALLAAGLVLTGCSSVDAPEGGENSANPEAISFRFRVPNQTKADPVGLETVSKSFGVWAVKANGFDGDDGLNTAVVTSIAEGNRTIMNNYLVGHNSTGGYLNADYSTADSYWWYEGLGSGDGYTVPTGLPASNREHQYLKYWDYSYDYTYFLAYAPYITGNNTPELDMTGASGSTGPTLKFKTAMGPGGEDCMYAKTCVSRSAAVNADLTHYGDKVPLTFNRLSSDVRISFWTNITDYKVYLENVVFAGESDEHGVCAMPATFTAPSTYGWGQIVATGTPWVTIDLANAGATDEVKYVNAAQSDGTGIVLDFGLPTEEQLTTTNTAAIPSASMYMLPNVSTSLYSDEGTTEFDDAAKSNAGLQFVINFKLVANDTGEVIHVKNARVFVDKTHTQWSPNHVYTYRFCITKAATGNTDISTTIDKEPTAPDPQALFPIIFDNITVANQVTEEATEIDVNPVP